MEDYRSAKSDESRLRREFPFVSNITDACLRRPESEQAGCILTWCGLQALFRSEGTEGCVTYGNAMSEIEKRINQAKKDLQGC
jgi:hypothetical protein